MGTIRHLVACVACTLALAACGQADKPPAAEEVSVVCTTFASYDWMRAIAGDTDGIALHYLLDEGVDMHSFQPSVADLALVSSADLLVYVGGESDAWVEDALASARNADIRALSLLEATGEAGLEEEVIEGMQTREGAGEDEEEEVELDEHVWLSPELAELLVGTCADELSALVPEDAETFQDNARAYQEKLHALDDRFRAAAAAALSDTVVFCDRFPFRYLFDELGLTYYAAFPGCSAETEASFETIVFLIEKVDELDLDCVLVCEDSDRRLADTVVANTQGHDQQVLVLDSLQAVSADEVDAGYTYLATMHDNLHVLERALTGGSEREGRG